MRNWTTRGAASLLGLFLGLLAPAQADTTEATQNVLATNTQAEIRQDVAQAMRRASVVRLQEAWTPRVAAAIRQARRDRPGWSLSVRVMHTGDPILWNASVWSSTGRARAIRATRGVSGLTPDRFLVWKPLRLRATGQQVVIANVHAVSGYCSGRPQQALRQRLARDYWRTVLAWTRRQQARHPDRTILLGGDFNCWLGKAHPWPRRALARLYRLDRAPWYDHLLTARAPGAPATLRRWVVPAHSDHDLNLRRLDLG